MTDKLPSKQPTRNDILGDKFFDVEEQLGALIENGLFNNRDTIIVDILYKELDINPQLVLKHFSMQDETGCSSKECILNAWCEEVGLT